LKNEHFRATKLKRGFRYQKFYATLRNSKLKNFVKKRGVCCFPKKAENQINSKLEKKKDC
jgi:hypothetical protein